MNEIRKVIRFLLGIVLFGCVVWGVVELISTGDMVASTPYLVPVFVFYFMFDTKIRITDLEKHVKSQKARAYLDMYSTVVPLHKPNLSKSEPTPEQKTEEGKETT